jgi:ribonucleoside-diphosphate reductase alpha chain
LGEIFIDSFKQGSSLRAMLDNFAISISYNLQYGVPLDTLIQKFVFTDFEPNGFVDGHPEVFTCKSILDAIFRILDIEYNKNKRYSHLIHSDGEKSEKKIINGKKDYGPSCKYCGNLTIRQGTCYLCLNCSNTSGCS